MTSTGGKGLVEPEGVNAGSAASTDETSDGTAPPEAARRGGDPRGAPDDGDPATTPSEDTALAAPSSDEGDPGQDGGAIDGTGAGG